MPGCGAHLPVSPRLSFNWGDARIGNILFRDFAPVAVLDWEMATLGPPEADLAWWLVFNRIHISGRGLAGPAGFPSEAEAVEQYEADTGWPVRDLRYYQVWAALRAGLLLFRFNDMMVRGGTIDDWFPEGGPPPGPQGAGCPARPVTPGARGPAPVRRTRAVAPR